ncbi:hypothetical protein NPIL_512601 [Nephila pilipes]|uniref:Uncharacterized protein n=1 Tax=Nephila pilipes TaxID=299642 RepID=A0A8X6QPT8_NEPPI|nr:hypothetical protein NPIL_512601 [Nephila pilipes]
MDDSEKIVFHVFSNWIYVPTLRHQAKSTLNQSKGKKRSVRHRKRHLSRILVKKRKRNTIENNVIAFVFVANPHFTALMSKNHPLESTKSLRMSDHIIQAP